VGVGLSAVTLIAAAGRGETAGNDGAGSSAAAGVSRQTMLCAYLSAALLVGLMANALADWWWAEPAVALLIGAAALREARDAWRGNSCSCC
jgi:hypothetical protein